MRKCKIHHTGLYIESNGFIRDGKVYAANDKYEEVPISRYFDPSTFENNVAQFSLDDKWGHFNIVTHDITTEPIWHGFVRASD